MWTQPVLTANGTIGINNFAVASGGGADSDAYKAFDSSASSYCNKMNSGAWLEFYSAVTLTIRDILITSQGGLPSQGIFQISHDAGTTWEQCGTWTDTDGLGESAHVIFDDGSATGRYFRFLSQGKSLAKPSNNADFCNVTITADEASGDFDFCADLERDIVHKSLLAESLKVWLPFDESTTKDLCWNGWTTYGSPTIQDDTLYLPGSSSYLAMTDGITLGGQNFTIRGKFNMDSAAGKWCRIFEIFNTSGSEADAIRLARDNTNSTLSFGCFNVSNTCSITLGSDYDFECCYVHSAGKFYFFLDGVLKVTLSINVPRTAFNNVWLGRSNYSADGYFVGSIDEFQIYDGIALHTTNFTPPTDDDYAQAKADWDGRFSLIANTERKLTNQAWIDDALKTYLTFDASPIDDLKGNTWTTYGNPTIGLNNSFTGHALQLDGSSYIKLSSIQLGGKSFYVDGWVYVDSSSPNNARVIHIVNPSTGYGLVSVRKNKDNASRLDFWTNSYADVSKDSGQTRVSTIDSIGQLVHFKLVYRYDNKRILFFINDTFTVSYDSCPQYNRQTFDIYIGALPNGNQGVIGAIDEVRIYDGWYLSYGYETPPTADEYNQQKLRLAGYQVVDEKSVDLERNLSNASFNPAPFLKVWLPFDTSTTEDYCGNTWTANTEYYSQTLTTNGAISGTALNLDNTHGESSSCGSRCLTLQNGITLGKKSFTIKGSFSISAHQNNSNEAWRLFILTNSYSTVAGYILYVGENISLAGWNKTIYFECLGETTQKIPVELNKIYSFELVFHHGLGKVFGFINGQLVGTINKTIPRTKFSYVWIDYAAWGRADRPLGTLDEFRVYDGVALHTENFTPAAPENYCEKCLEAEKQAPFLFDITTVREVVYEDWIEKFDVSVWLPFENSITEDICGSEWTVLSSANATISSANARFGNALQLTTFEPKDSSYKAIVSMVKGLYLGGKDFKIDIWFRLNSSNRITSSYVFAFMPEDFSLEKSIVLHRDVAFSGGITCLALLCMGGQIPEGNLSGVYSAYRYEWGRRYHAVVEYNHADKLVSYYLDDNLIGTLEMEIPRTYFPVVGLDWATTSNSHITGTIDNFLVHGAELIDNAPKIYLCVRRDGEIISLPLRNYDSPITPALAIRYDGKNWYGKLVALNDSNAGAVHLRHNNSDYALAIN